MLGDDGAYQKEPKAGAFPGMRGIIGDLLERLADTGQQTLRHADARIADHDPDAVAGDAGGNSDAAALAGELDRVGQKIGENLAQAARISGKADRR